MAWLKEISRDLLAFGSIPFYFIVVIRAIIGKFPEFVYQMVIAAILLFLLSLILPIANLHIARALVIVVFTSLFYKEFLFTFFAVFVFILLLLSSFYLKKKLNYVLLGIILGLISCIISYTGVNMYLTHFA